MNPAHRASRRTRATFGAGSLVALTVLAACGGGSGSAPSTAFPMTFKVQTASYGQVDFPCDPSSSGVFFTSNLRLSIFCNQKLGPSSSETVAAVSLAGFHGGDTYEFQGSLSFDESAVQFTFDNYGYESIPAESGSPATTCSVVVTAPAQPKKGDPISGTFHCDAVAGSIVKGDGGYVAPRTTAVDGEFSGAMSF